jgi:hypothetical protein
MVSPAPRDKSRGWNGDKPRPGLAELARRGFNTTVFPTRPDAACPLDAESAQADFAFSKRRIHSLRGGRTARYPIRIARGIIPCWRCGRDLGQPIRLPNGLRMIDSGAF